MKMTCNKYLATAIFLSVSGGTLSVMAAETADLNYQDIGWVKQELSDRGFVKGPAPSGAVQYWWNGQAQQCIRLTVKHGKVDDITSEQRDECGAVAQNSRSPASNDVGHRGHKQHIAVNQMPSYCLEFAAQDLGKYKSDISTLPAEKNHGNYVVPGQSDDVFFECTFSRDGTFIGMNLNR